MNPPLLRTPALRIRSDLFTAQELIEIETNPFFYLRTRLKVLGKRDDDTLHQLDFIYVED
jgi:hypothetical protein